MTLLTDVQQLRVEVGEIKDLVEVNRSGLERHEEQINGRRGQSAAIDAVASEIKSLRRAAYWVAGIIVSGSIGFAFTVFELMNRTPT